MTEEQKLVEFRINGELYGVEIDLVKEILNTWTIIPVLTLQEKIAGVIFLRGNNVPVINMRRLLGVEKPDAEITGQRIIIIGMGNAMGRSFGLLVDSVSNVIELVDHTVEKIHLLRKTESFPFEKGYVDGRIVEYGENHGAIRGDIHPSVKWLDSDTLIESAMKGCEIFEPKIPYL